MISRSVWTRQDTGDLDQFRALIRPVRTQVTVTGRGPFAAHISRIDVNGLWMQRIQESSQRVMHGQLDSRRVSFIFLTDAGPGMAWNGVETPPSGITMNAPGHDFSHRLAGATNWGTMSLDVDDLRQIGTAVAGKDLIPRLHEPPSTPAPLAMAKLLRLHAVAEHLAINAPEVLMQPEAARGLEQALIQALITCIEGSDIRRERATRQRHHLIMRRFFAALERYSGEPVYVPELCAAIDVPVRTLRMCCQEYLGLSPKKFLLLRRMHLAHRALINSDPDRASVTDIATRYGFWELGRFAVVYRSVFGKTPSATLRH